MPFIQRFVEPRYLSRTQLFDEDGHPKVADEELQAVSNNTLCNALRQLASLVLAADDIFSELGGQLQGLGKRSTEAKARIQALEEKVAKFDPKQVTVRANQRLRRAESVRRRDKISAVGGEG
ncbi:hypothetical protein NQ315_012662 [Exocentrus adspersus]|uniref:Uncharacterized protein n=1 Tax=Exocentrus adspersus TaxID=1586481 RepID=A0AAV8VSU7_9CUCU|nr:hypothetical protein NQ315_012662 [Exocentrus adspersus]